MTKKKLIEYIKSSKKVVKNTTKKNMIKEQLQDFDVPEGFSTRDLLFVVRYLETIRRSGLTNMYEVASLLNWTKSDLERWLYGQSKDLDSLEDDDEIEIIEKLIEEKDAVRDALIRTAIKKAENSGNYSDKTIQRYFERAANDAFGVFIKIR